MQPRKYWPHLLWIAAVALLATGTYKHSQRTPVSAINRGIPESRLKSEINRIQAELQRVELSRHCTVEGMADLETLLQYYQTRVTYDRPRSNDPSVSYGYEGDGPYLWIVIMGLGGHAKELRKQYCGTPFERVLYDDLVASTPAYQARMKFDLRTKSDISDFVRFQAYAIPALLLAIAFPAILLKRRGWKVREAVPPQVLKWAGCVLSFGVSLCSTPAMALQLFKQNKKDEQQKVRVWEGVRLANPLRAKPSEARFEAFGDSRHDRQQLLMVTRPVLRWFDGFFINQNRQSLTTDSRMAHIGFGARIRWGSRLTLTATTGPQYALEKGRVDSFTTFLIGSYKSPDLALTSVNRFSRGIDGKVSPAHRHITQIRAGPMPEWLMAQWEFRRVLGRTDEDFRGAYVGIGKLFRLKNSWMKGFYLYPHRDFVKKNWDMRIGWSRTFAFD